MRYVYFPDNKLCVSHKSAGGSRRIREATAAPRRYSLRVPGLSICTHCPFHYVQDYPFQPLLLPNRTARDNYATRTATRLYVTVPAKPVSLGIRQQVESGPVLPAWFHRLDASRAMSTDNTSLIGCRIRLEQLSEPTPLRGRLPISLVSFAGYDDKSSRGPSYQRGSIGSTPGEP